MADGGAEYPTDWGSKAAFMRSVSATSASWDEHGTLLALHLGEPSPLYEPSRDTTTQPLTPEQKEEARLKERRRVLTAAGSKLVGRIG